MKYLFLDTNIYIDMVVSRDESHKPESYNYIKELLGYGEIRLIVPNIVISEVFRHIDDEIDKVGRAVKDIKNNVKNLYWINHSDELQKFNSKFSPITKNVNALYEEYKCNEKEYKKSYKKRFDELFNNDNCIRISENEKIVFNAMQRKVYKKKPFNETDKDCMADSIIIETLINIKDFVDIDIEKDKVYFITRNKDDFSKNSKDYKNYIHKDIQESLEENRLQDTVKYSIFYYKTLLNEFEEEISMLGLIKELEAEALAESESELEERENEEVDYLRTMGGLSSLSTNFEDIIYDIYDVDKLIGSIESLKESVSKKFNIYNDKYDSLLDTIDKISLDNLNELLKEDKILNIIIGNKKNEIDLKDNLKEIIGMELDNEYYYDINSIFESNGFSLDSNIFKFCDLYNNKYKLIAEGNLEPSNGEEDKISLNLYKNENLVAHGSISVYYGFFELDEDGNAGNGAKEEIIIDFEKIENYLPIMIEDTLEDVNEKIEKVDLLCKIISG